MESGLWNSRSDIAEDSKAVLSTSHISYMGHWAIQSQQKSYKPVPSSQKSEKKVV